MILFINDSLGRPKRVPVSSTDVMHVATNIANEQVTPVAVKCVLHTGGNSCIMNYGDLSAVIGQYHHC